MNAWPARIARPIRSIASGSCCSILLSRWRRALATCRVGIAPAANEAQSDTTAEPTPSHEMKAPPAAHSPVRPMNLPAVNATPDCVSSFSTASRPGSRVKRLCTSRRLAEQALLQDGNVSVAMATGGDHLETSGEAPRLRASALHPPKVGTFKAQYNGYKNRRSEKVEVDVHGRSSCSIVSVQRACLVPGFRKRRVFRKTWDARPSRKNGRRRFRRWLCRSA